MNCITCNLSFKSKRCLQAHLKTKKHLEGNVEKKYKCHCGKSFSFNQGLHAHKKKCTSKEFMSEVQILRSENEELRKKQEEIEFIRQQEKEEMKRQIEELLDKFSQFQGQSTVNTTNNTHNIGTQNNIHIHINAFGKENMDYITNEFMGECVKKIYNSVPSLIQKIHFDPDHPENHNVKITNKKLPHASVMSEDQQWKLVNKQEAIEDMIDKGYNMIDEKFREDPSLYTEERRRNYRKYQDNYDNEDKDTRKRLKNDVEYVILNGTKEIHTA